MKEIFMEASRYRIPPATSQSKREKGPWEGDEGSLHHQRNPMGKDDPRVKIGQRGRKRASILGPIN
jgi:hypothetical protein